ncbi:MAG: hypothetical protein ACOCQG_06205, partial [Candidatus Nanoarchaeia archaeon]
VKEKFIKLYFKDLLMNKKEHILFTVIAIISILFLTFSAGALLQGILYSVLIAVLAYKYDSLVGSFCVIAIMLLFFMNIFKNLYINVTFALLMVFFVFIPTIIYNINIQKKLGFDLLFLYFLIAFIFATALAMAGFMIIAYIVKLLAPLHAIVILLLTSPLIILFVYIYFKTIINLLNHADAYERDALFTHRHFPLRFLNGLKGKNDAAAIRNYAVTILITLLLVGFVKLSFVGLDHAAILSKAIPDKKDHYDDLPRAYSQRFLEQKGYKVNKEYKCTQNNNLICLDLGEFDSVFYKCDIKMNCTKQEQLSQLELPKGKYTFLQATKNEKIYLFLIPDYPTKRYLELNFFVNYPELSKMKISEDLTKMKSGLSYPGLHFSENKALLLKEFFTGELYEKYYHLLYNATLVVNKEAMLSDVKQNLIIENLWLNRKKFYDNSSIQGHKKKLRNNIEILRSLGGAGPFQDIRKPSQHNTQLQMPGLHSSLLEGLWDDMIACSKAYRYLVKSTHIKEDAHNTLYRDIMEFYETIDNHESTESNILRLKALETMLAYKNGCAKVPEITHNPLHCKYINTNQKKDCYERYINYIPNCSLVPSFEDKCESLKAS